MSEGFRTRKEKSTRSSGFQVFGERKILKVMRIPQLLGVWVAKVSVEAEAELILALQALPRNVVLMGLADRTVEREPEAGPEA